MPETTTYRPLHRENITITESGGVTKHLAVTAAGDYPASEGGVIAGILEHDADENDICQIITHGSALWVTGENVTAGARLLAGADGKAYNADAASVVLASGSDSPDLTGSHTFSGGYLPQYIVGIALTSADSGERVRVLLK